MPNPANVGKTQDRSGSVWNLLDSQDQLLGTAHSNLTSLRKRLEPILEDLPNTKVESGEEAEPDQQNIPARLEDQNRRIQSFINRIGEILEYLQI